MVDHSQMKLGKKARRLDGRTLKLARYLTAALPSAPVSVDWSHQITDWGMMCNDKLGCCTIAAVGHALQTWTANALGRELTVPDSSILAYYEKWDGYNPSDASTDQGGVELDVLKSWQQQGFDGNGLDAFAGVSPASEYMVQPAINLFGGLYIGVELPVTAQNQTVWDTSADSAESTDAQPGSWGGHAIYLVGYDAIGPVCVTWGLLKKMTWAWFGRYCSEAYALISKDWLEATGITPGGLDLAALEADLKIVTA